MEPVRSLTLNGLSSCLQTRAYRRKETFSRFDGNGLPGLLIGMLDRFRWQLLAEPRGRPGLELAATLSSAAMTQSQPVHRAGDGDIEQPALFVERALSARARMRKQTILETDDINVRKFQALATVHRNERDRVAGVFPFFLALVIERQFFEKALQSFRWRQRPALPLVHRCRQVLHIAHPAFRGFDLLFRTAQLLQVTGLIQKMVGPGLKKTLRQKSRCSCE